MTDAKDALRRLVERLDEVHKAERFQAVWYCAHHHLGPYDGPTYTAELSAARAALALPPSPPAIDEELLGHAKTALAEHAKLYAINADMLAALQRLADVVEGGHYRNPIDLTTELDQARSAIARATGREGKAMTTTRERALEAALIDAKALLDHYTSGRPDNWDGSTKGQALATIREATAALALPPSPQPSPVAVGKHTPGPWNDLEANCGDGLTIYNRVNDARGRRIAHTACYRDSRGNILDAEEAAANASLIAAAPDMLAALKLLLPYAVPNDVDLHKPDCRCAYHQGAAAVRVSNPVTHDDALRGRLNTRQALEYIRNEMREQIDGDSPRDGWVSDLIRVADMALERGDGR